MSTGTSAEIDLRSSAHEGSRPRRRLVDDNTSPSKESAKKSFTGKMLGLAALVAVTIAILVLFLVGRNDAERAAMIGMVLSALVAGGLLGALVVSPGAGSGESGTAAANTAGWASRLGVFGTWITGAAFALLIANGSAVAGWFVDMTASVAGNEGATATQRAVLVQYSLGSLLIAATAGGFVLGFLLMATNGRTVLAEAAAAERLLTKMEDATGKVEAATDQAKMAAEAVDSASAELQAAVSSVKVTWLGDQDVPPESGDSEED